MLQKIDIRWWLGNGGDILIDRNANILAMFKLANLNKDTFNVWLQ
jgi:hypothetical protein